MNKFITNLKVHKKLFFLSTSMITLLAVTSILAVSGFFIIQSRISSFYEEDYQARIYANQMMRYFEQYQKYTLYVMLDKDEEMMNSYADTANEIASKVIETKDNLIEVYDGTVDMNKLSEEIAAIPPVRKEVVELAMAWKTDEAYTMSQEQWLPLVEAATDTLSEVIEDTKHSGDEMIAAIKLQIYALIIIVAILLVISILFGMYISKKIRNGILKPVSEIKAATEVLSEGNFNLDLNYESGDEFGDVVNALKNTVENQKIYLDGLQHGITALAEKNLNAKPEVEIKGEFALLRDKLIETLEVLSKTISVLQDSSTQVTQGSEQLAQTAQALAEGSTDQAGAVEELLATISDITQQVEQNAKSAAEASKKAQDAEEGAQESSTRMDEMVEAMTRISDTSKKIEMIIQSIENIASQTNLLSLNAAIEAARAGEAGKGFAVVAGEISELANQSAQAAADTRNLIGDSIREVETGNKIAAATAEALNIVREKIDEIKEVSENVMTASENQSEAMNQINTGVEQISSVVQSNAAAAEESSATSEELAAQAAALNEIASEFILRED